MFSAECYVLLSFRPVSPGKRAATGLLNLEKNHVEEAEPLRQQNRALIPAQLNSYLLKDSHLAEQGK